MNKTVRVTVAALAVLLVSGCGAGAKKKLTADLTACQSSSANLQAKVDTLTKQNAEFQAQVDAAQAQAAALAAEQERLKASQAEATTKYDQVVNQLASEVQSGNLKIRQYQNM